MRPGSANQSIWTGEVSSALNDIIKCSARSQRCESLCCIHSCYIRNGRFTSKIRPLLQLLAAPPLIPTPPFTKCVSGTPTAPLQNRQLQYPTWSMPFTAVLRGCPLIRKEEAKNQCCYHYPTTDLQASLAPSFSRLLHTFQHYARAQDCIIMPMPMACCCLDRDENSRRFPAVHNV